MTHPLSNCCKAKAVVSVADEGTACYMCTGCNKPCDPHQEGEEKPTTQSWEEEFDAIYMCNCYLCKDSNHSIKISALSMKSFIRQTLATAEAEWKARLVKEVEEIFRKAECRTKYDKDGEIKSYAYRNHSQVKGYNQALSDIITLINSTK